MTIGNGPSHHKAGLGTKNALLVTYYSIPVRSKNSSVSRKYPQNAISILQTF